MKNNTDRSLKIATMFMGGAFAYSVICLIVFGLIFIWGFFSPQIFNFGTWDPNLKVLRINNMAGYVFMGLIIIGTNILATMLFWKVIKMCNNINFQKPFDELLIDRIQEIAMILFLFSFAGIFKEWIDEFFSVQSPRPIFHFKLIFSSFLTLTLGSILYIFSLVFRKGLQLQNDNDLTV